MAIDDFAPNLSFFFSNGMDPEYTVLGRVARRIWAIAMRDRYGADERVAEAQVPRADLGPVAARPGDGLQRHPHHPAGPHRHLRQLQQPAHQRLRRGRHHPVGRVGAPGPRHPADHQPGVGPGHEREPAAGLVHRRRAHRPGRGGGAGRVRPPDASAGACSAPWRPATSGAASRTSRCSTRAASTTARCPSSASTPSATPTATPGTRQCDWPARPTTRSSLSCGACATSRPATPASDRPCWPGSQKAAIAGDNLFEVLMDAVRCCSLGEITDALFEVGGQYRRNV